jgi:2-(1,2-epoxy-1,2-dihydrophenyl)acetyl-CoA isomerase
MPHELLESVTDRVATLTLNRPDRLNALSSPMLDALLDALPRLAADPQIAVVVLTGAGRGFCAGGDVKTMAEGSSQLGVEDAVQRLRGRMEVSRLLHEIPKPTIAMVNFTKVGFSGDFGGSYFLSKLVGTAKARELYYTGEPLDAAQALALGIVNRVVPDSELADATMTLATRLARGPSIALGLMKQNFNAAETGTLSELLDLEALHQIKTGRTEDHLEAARAFVEKRPPIFRGR